MTDIITPRLQRMGGGGYMLDRIRSGQHANASFVTPAWIGYKLKVDGSGYWDKNQTTALAAATSQVITIGTTFEHSPFPTNVVILAVLVRVITPFAGVTTPILAVGDAGNEDEWIDELDLTAAAAIYSDQGDADAVNAAGGFSIPEAGYAPILTLNTGAGNMTALTAGEADIQFLCVSLPLALP
jgi:hypothetical protein